MLLLLAAAVLSAVLGDVTGAVVILVVVVLNAAIGFRQEYGAERAMAALQAMSAPTVRLVCATARPARCRVVAGDVVTLDAGARVPADGRLLEAHAIRARQARPRVWPDTEPISDDHGLESGLTSVGLEGISTPPAPRSATRSPPVATPACGRS